MKPLWEITVTTTPEAEDAVAEWLGSQLNSAVSSYYDQESDISRVSLYGEKAFPPETRRRVLAGLKQIENYGLKIGTGRVQITKVKREDWAESWKKHFKPLNVGNLLLVRPSWSKKCPRRGQAEVVLDPGLSFGTGQHPTTAFCLAQIVRYSQKSTRKSFLDIGTGSGILAIAAAKFNFQPIRAFDSDPEAIRVAKANARVNCVSTKVKILRDDVTKLSARPREQFDLVCANLISNLLIAEKRVITGQVKPGGTLVLAGILVSEFSEVQAAYAAMGWKLTSARANGEWQSAAFCRF